MTIDPLARLLGPWAQDFTAGSVLLRILVSTVLAAIIGCERASKRHSAGLRTFIFVALGSTIAMMIDSEFGGGRPFLLSAATIVGVAILSVNSLFFSSRGQIKGLTTSAALWVSCVIGLATGAGCYTVTLIAYLTLYVSLSRFIAFESYLKNRSNHFEIHLELTSAGKLRDFVSTLRELGLAIDDIECNPAYANSGLSVYSIALSIENEDLKKFKTHTEIISALRSIEYVSHIEEMHG